jgi:uncharacterized membrane protein YgcG
MSRVRLLWHVARLVVDYFDYAVRPGASAHRVACHAARRAARHRLLHLAQARRRLLRLRRTSGCLVMSRGSPRGSSRRSSSTTPPRAGSSSTTSPTLHVQVPRLVALLVVDYFAYAARPGASAHCASRRAARRRLLHLAQARRRLLRLRHASRCLGTSDGSSRRSSSTTLPCAGSSSTTSPTPRVRVPRHVASLVTRLVALLVVDYSTSCRLVVDYFAYDARPGASARRAARHMARRAARR